MRAHATRRHKCRVRVRGTLRFHWRFPDRGSFRVRDMSQQVPGAKPTAGQWSPRRAELRAQVRVPVRFSLWVTRPHTSPGPGRGGLQNHLGQLQPSLGNDMVNLQIPCRVCTSCVPQARGVVRRWYWVPMGRDPQLGLGFRPGTSPAQSDYALVMSLEG